MEGQHQLRRMDLLYPDLSYIINGILFSVYRQLGGGHKESYYQKAVATALRDKGIKFVEQYYVPLKYNNQIVGKYYLDFLIEDKIVLELKRGKYLVAKVIDQTNQYLKTLNLQLAIIACFTYTGVTPKRIININNH
ncbi:MAG: GxxExxY protein [Patescibacteria group bacterium]